jgi:hypothetical protein
MTTPHLTKAQLIEEGRRAAGSGPDDCEDILEACETRNLSGDARLFFEQGYFTFRLVPQVAGQGVVCAHPISTNRP